MTERPIQPIRPAKAESRPDVPQHETVHHESANKKRKTTHKVSQLNLTSMLDVCFQLLIFFVLTASFTKGEGVLPAELPTGTGKAADVDAPDQPINIMLRSLGGEDVAVEIQGMPSPFSSFDELYKKLKSLQNTPANPTAPYNADDPVIIKPGRTVQWGHVVNAFNAAVRAKYTNINFAQPEG